MMKLTPHLACLLLLTVFFQCTAQPVNKDRKNLLKPAAVILGNQRMSEYMPMLVRQRVGLVVNQSSLIGKTHLVDTLLTLGVEVTTIFTPEHGLRGTAEAGEHVNNSIDAKTKIPIISLYGDHKQPTDADLQKVDVVIFDLQDVGTRFYTYISTLHYMMQAVARNKKILVVLDRPNPNGHFIDGPVLEKEHQSFVGMHTIPVVHGLTVGELAQMINGENWLGNGEDNQVYCNLTVVPCDNYTHHTPYRLPIKPSPNLPNQKAIYLYPSLCFFEGTPISVGRKSLRPFQQYGSADLLQQPDTFKLDDKLHTVCHGRNLSNMNEDSLFNMRKINLQWLIDAYQNYPQKDKFFTPYFTTLAGTKTLQQQIVSGMSENEIRKTWQPGLQQYKLLRKKYLLYAD